MSAYKHIRSTLVVLFLLTMLLAACAPQAAEPTTVAQEAREVGQAVTESVAVEGETLTEPLPVVVQPPAPTSQPPAVLPGATPPADNYFENYGVNPFVDAYEDNLSTFALDVDTASYTVARRYVSDGNLPPAEAVRVEEFVNYFDGGYPIPPDIAFGVYADGAPSPFSYDGVQILRIGVQGYQVPEEQRKPAVLTFVIDVSGSMDMENRLGLVKQSLQMLVDRLRPTDSVAIVVYGTQARMILPPTSGEAPGVILEAIHSLRPEGSTNAEAGLRLGYQLASQAYQPGVINRVILCSDGVANVGATGPDQILETIRVYADAGITLTSVGFGMGNFNDVLMEQLADGGDGSYAYVDTLDEAERLFVDNLTSTLQVIALDAKVQVDFNREVVSRYRLIGYENRDIADQDFRNDQVDAGEIGAGHSVTALYALYMHPGAQGRLATVQLRWEDPDTHQVLEINGNVNTWDLAPSFESAAPRYQLAVVAAQYAEVLRRSPYALGTSIYNLRDHSSRLAGLLPGDRDVAEFSALVSRASQIAALAEQ